MFRRVMCAATVTRRRAERFQWRFRKSYFFPKSLLKQKNPMEADGFAVFSRRTASIASNVLPVPAKPVTSMRSFSDRLSRKRNCCSVQDSRFSSNDLRRAAGLDRTSNFGRRLFAICAIFPGEASTPSAAHHIPFATKWQRWLEKFDPADWDYVRAECRDLISEQIES